LSGWDSDFFKKNKKLFAGGARDSHAPVGPTPSPLPERLAAKSILSLHFAGAFWAGRFGRFGLAISGWRAVGHLVSDVTNIY